LTNNPAAYPLTRPTTGPTARQNRSHQIASSTNRAGFRRIKIRSRVSKKPPLSLAQRRFEAGGQLIEIGEPELGERPTQLTAMLKRREGGERSGAS
jgi:hypothetical protein